MSNHSENLAVFSKRFLSAKTDHARVAIVGIALRAKREDVPPLSGAWRSLCEVLLSVAEKDGHTRTAAALSRLLSTPGYFEGACVVPSDADTVQCSGPGIGVVRPDVCEATRDGKGRYWRPMTAVGFRRVARRARVAIDPATPLASVADVATTAALEANPHWRVDLGRGVAVEPVKPEAGLYRVRCYVVTRQSQCSACRSARDRARREAKQTA